MLNMSKLNQLRPHTDILLHRIIDKETLIYVYERASTQGYKH
jgi:hypothetical protein